MQSLVKTCLEMCAVDLTEVYSPALFNERSMQLGLSTGVAAQLENGWNLDTKSRRDKCSSELRAAKPQDFIADPPCPLFLKLQNSNIGKSTQLEESFAKTSKSTTCVAECFRVGRVKQVARVFGSPSFVRTWMQKEPTRCPYVGLTLTRAMRIETTTGLV